VGFHPSGTCIGAALVNGEVKIYETQIRKILILYTVYKGAVNSLSFETFENYLVMAPQEGYLKCWTCWKVVPAIPYDSKSPCPLLVT